jgi:predicted nucleic acid-binding protein
MNAVFADTYYFIALLNRADEGHPAAVKFTAKFTGEIFTTTFVLAEVGDGMCALRDRQKFTAALRDLRNNAHVHIVHPNESLFQVGCDLFSHRSDKEWSITDCLSFVTMEQHSIREALTADQHFEQAGFVALLK